MIFDTIRLKREHRIVINLADNNSTMYLAIGENQYNWCGIGINNHSCFFCNQYKKPLISISGYLIPKFQSIMLRNRKGVLHFYLNDKLRGSMRSTTTGNRGVLLSDGELKNGLHYCFKQSVTSS